MADATAAALARFDAAFAAHRRAADRLTIEAAALRALIAPPASAADGEATETLARLRETAEARGFQITGDGFLAERDAAELLGRSPSTLRRWRAEGAGPAWRRRLGRVEYALSDLADFVASTTDPGD